MFRIGIDLGGTKIEGIVIDADGKELYRKRIPTEREKGYEHILKNIKTVYDTMANHIERKPHTFGIGTPGWVSRKTGLMSLSNTTCMNGKPAKTDIEQTIGRPLEIQNDANCFAMAEAIYGAGKGHEMVFGVIMGTGCGGGIVYKGQVISGTQGLGGEWGHMSIDPNGPQCFCGKKGCVETYISGTWVQKHYEEKNGKKLSMKEIEAAYFAKDPAATETVQHMLKHFGIAVANLVTVLDPDIIVIGGGVSNFKEIYTKGRDEVVKCTGKPHLETKIVQHKLGDSAGVIGAALIGI